VSEIARKTEIGPLIGGDVRHRDEKAEARNTRNIEVRTRRIRLPLGWWIGLVCCLMGLIVTGSLVSPGGRGETPLVTICLALLIIAIAAWTARIRFNTWGAGDPLFLFAIFFALYNGSVLSEMGFAAIHELPAVFIYNAVQFRDFFNAGSCSALAATGMLISAIILDRSERGRISNNLSGSVCSRGMASRLFWIGASTLIITILLAVVLVLITVGAREFLSSSRAGSYANPGRINPSLVLGIALPIIPFTIAGLGCMSLGVCLFPTRWKTKLFAALVVFFTLFNFIQGERHLVAYMVIIAAGAYATRFTLTRQRKRKIIFIAICTYLIFVVISGIRTILPDLFNKNATTNDLYRSFLSFSGSWMLPSNNEFVGPYFTLVDTLQNRTEPKLGKTYASAILYILPTKLYPGIKPESLGEEFAIMMSERISNPIVLGFGFSPVAEAILNFGWEGIMIIFAMLAAGMHWLGRLRQRGLVGLLIYLAILPQVINANRYSMDGVMQESAFSLMAMGILWMIARANRRYRA